MNACTFFQDVLRSVAYVRNLVRPSQAVRDASEQYHADKLADFEAETEVWEWEPHECNGDCCIDPRWSFTGPGSFTLDSSPATPLVGDVEPAGVIPPTPAGSPTFEALQQITADILKGHDGYTVDLMQWFCRCGEALHANYDHRDHVAELITSAVVDAYTVAANTPQM